MENNHFNVGERIRELRTNQGLSQEQLALRAEITTTYLGLIERNLKNPTVKILEQICTSLNTSLSDFFCTSSDSCNSLDNISVQILAQLNDRTLKEKQFLLKLMKNLLSFRDLSDETL